MGPHSFVTKVIIKKGNSFVSKVYLFYIYMLLFMLPGSFLGGVGCVGWIRSGRTQYNTVLAVL